MAIEDLKIKDKQFLNFNWLKLIDIDTILLSTRHLFRMPYSINEKSGLVSIPVNPNKILSFKKDMAKIENVNPNDYEDFEFLKSNGKKDCNILLEKIDGETNSFLDFVEKNVKKNLNTKLHDDENKIKIEYEIFGKINEKDFPESIKYILKNKDLLDGRKRIVFLLMTFLYGINYEKKEVEDIINNWNDNLEEKLKQQYLQAQFSWFNSQAKKITPPNFDNSNYYNEVGIPKEIIEKDVNKIKGRIIKNPLQYISLLQRNKKT